MSRCRWRRNQAEAFAATVEREEWHDIRCGRCRRVLGNSIITTEAGGRSVQYEGEPASLMVFGQSVKSFVLCEPCAGLFTAWVEAGPTAAERAREAHQTWAPEDAESELQAMRELRGKHE